MTTTAPAPVATGHARTPSLRAWLRLLAWTVGVVAAVDLAFMALIREAIPPLLVGAVMTGVGLALARRLPRTAVVVLGLTSLLMLVGALQFTAEHLSHPSSGIDFLHAVVGIVGRVTAIAVAVAALRSAPAAGARRVGAASVGLFAVTMLVAAVATVATTGDDAQPGDVLTTVTDHEFDETIEVAAGGTLFVDNRDLVRHTFTVEGTSTDVELPAKQGARVPVDLPAGSYEVICAVPGHERMHATLEVR